MKILCVIDSLGSGGAQRQLISLATGFKENGHDVSFLVYHEINFFKELLDHAGIPVYLIIEPNYIRRLYKMRKYIRKSKSDAVLSFLEGSNFITEIAGLPFRRWKLVVGERSANPDIYRSTRLRTYRWFHLFADYVVSNSHENLKMVRKINPFLSKQKCKVIYNMVDREKWKPAIDYVPLKNKKLNLVVAASHQYLKNARGLIEALHKLKPKDRSRLIINWYGDESPDNSFKESKALIQKYNLQDIFSFHKATIGIVKKMQYADVIGLFSFYEGLPNIVCEAMVLGKPIISSNVSDIPDLLKSDRNCIFEPHNITDINRILLYILSLTEDQLHRIGVVNNENGLLMFNRDKIISSYETLLT